MEDSTTLPEAKDSPVTPVTEHTKTPPAPTEVHEKKTDEAREIGVL